MVETKIQDWHTADTGGGGDARRKNEGRESRDVFVRKWESNGGYRTARNAGRPLPQNGESAYDVWDAGEYYAERKRERSDDAADNEVR